MDAQKEKIQKLAAYFGKRADVAMAFLFGSRAKGYARQKSDWDIGVYFIPERIHTVELEVMRDFPQTSEIHTEVERMVGEEADIVVLNRVAPAVVYAVLNRGTALVLKDKLLYWELVRRTFYEALDFWQLTEDFAKIRFRSQSLASEDRSVLTRLLVFLENEMEDFPRFEKITQVEYTEDKDTKRIIERWIENLAMSAIDISKILLASEKRDVPDSYREILRTMGFVHFDETFAHTFAEFAEFRNFVAHEYLDLRWKRISRFMMQAKSLYPQFISKVKEILDYEKK